jgi:hypothetical protein
MLLSIQNFLNDTTNLRQVLLGRGEKNVLRKVFLNQDGTQMKFAVPQHFLLPRRRRDELQQLLPMGRPTETEQATKTKINKFMSR